MSEEDDFALDRSALPTSEPLGYGVTIPRSANVVALAPVHVQRYLGIEIRTAGKVSAGSYIFDAVMNADQIAGYGERPSRPDFQDALAALPQCRNDLEHGFVSGMCGYRRVSRGETLQSWRETASMPH